MLQTMVDALKRAGAIQSENYGSLLNVDEARRNDIKLEVDRLCEEAMVETIHATSPDHAILGEEGGARGAGDCVWILDPLDGTVNYFYGIPYFCSSAACYKRNDDVLAEPLAGAVYVPLRDELFLATPGEGATLNGRPVRAAEVAELSQSMVATGFGSTDEALRMNFAIQSRLAPRIRKLRCLGAAAYDLCNVGCGRLSGFYERGLYTWDIAAARIVIEEAGGRFDAVEYAPHRWDVVACAPGIFDDFIRVVRREGEES